MRWYYFIPVVALGLLYGLVLAREHILDRYYDCERGAFESQDGEFRVWGTEYLPALDKLTKKSVLILPPTGGVTFMDQSYASRLCSQGFRVRILERWTEDDEFSLDLGIHQRFYDRSQRAIKAAARDLPKGFVGLLGTSVGGIFGALAIGSMPDIQAAFLITAGGPIHSIVARSAQGILIEAREKRMATHNFRSMEEYEAALQAKIHSNPLKPILNTKDKKLGLVIAQKDETVPTRFQEALATRWHPAKIIRLPYGHIPAIVFTWLFHDAEIADFFRQSAGKGA